MSINTTIDCGSGCSTPIKPVSFSACSAEWIEAEINRIYLANDGNPLTDWTSLSEWNSRIDNTSTGATAIRELTVIGSLPVPEQSETVKSDGRTKYGLKNFTLSADIDDNSDVNYEFVRATGCNRTYRFWFQTVGGKLYGGPEGILAVLKADEDIPNDRNQDAILKLELKWKSQFRPERIPSPMAIAA